MGGVVYKWCTGCGLKYYGEVSDPCPVCVVAKERDRLRGLLADLRWVTGTDSVAVWAECAGCGNVPINNETRDSSCPDDCEIAQALKGGDA